jgi:uncharacterized OsmC-like protein
VLDTSHSVLLMMLSVSVAGCLGYDVLVIENLEPTEILEVSVAGCLGYDVLEMF